MINTSDVRPFITMHTDGAFKKRSGIGGWAALLQYGSEFMVSYGNAKHTTNNRMELMAVIQGIQQLTIPCHVHVVSDSEHVVKGINNWLHVWAHNGWKTQQNKQVANQDLWEILYRLKQTHQISAEWVRGHNGHSENELVDTFASSSCYIPV